MGLFGLSALFGLFAILGACATPFKEPQAGERARVRFVVEAGTPVEGRQWLDEPRAFVTGYDDENCTNEVQYGFLTTGVSFTGRQRRLQMPLWDFHENAATELHVLAGRRTLIMFEGNTISAGAVVNTHYACATFVDVVFDPNKDYELVYRMDGGDRCHAVLSELVAIDGGHERRRLQVFETSTLPSEGCGRRLRS